MYHVADDIVFMTVIALRKRHKLKGYKIANGRVQGNAVKMRL